MQKQSILPETGFIRLPTVLTVFPVSKTTLWEMIKNGTFPKPVKLGPRISAWPVEAIRNFLETVARSA